MRSCSRRREHDAAHVRSYGSDIEILQRARDGNRSIVSADSDFGVILASQGAAHPSFILFREPNLQRAEDYFDLLLPALPILEPELAAGCVAVFSARAASGSQTAVL